MAAVSATVAVAAGFALAEVSAAVKAPLLAGANCTVTVQVPLAARLVPVQVSPVMVNAAEPVSVSVSVPVAWLPVLASVNVCETGCPVPTCP